LIPLAEPVEANGTVPPRTLRQAQGPLRWWRFATLGSTKSPWSRWLSLSKPTGGFPRAPFDRLRARSGHFRWLSLSKPTGGFPRGPTLRQAQGPLGSL